MENKDKNEFEEAYYETKKTLSMIAKEDVKEDNKEDIKEDIQEDIQEDFDVKDSLDAYENLYENHIKGEQDNFGGHRVDTKEYIETEEDKVRSESDNSKEQGVKKKRAKQKLSDTIGAKQGVMILDNLCSIVSPLIYNRFSEHKTSRLDWKMTDDDKNLLVDPMKAFLDYIEVSPPNPITSLILAVGMVQYGRFGEIKSSKKYGTQVEKKGDNSTFSRARKNGNSGKYVKKYTDRSKKWLNPEHPQVNEFVQKGDGILDPTI